RLMQRAPSTPRGRTGRSWRDWATRNHAGGLAGHDAGSRWWPSVVAPDGMGVSVAMWRWLVSGLEFLRGWSLGSGSRGKEVEPERFGEVSGDALSPHAVACRVKRRGEGAEAS